MKVLDLFSAAAGGWSLGMHRAGFTTIAACEVVEWRRILYAQNNPDVRIYPNVRSLTADRLVSHLGCLPDVVVGSPPCQDISSANTKGEGVDGARSGLFFEAIRIIAECRPRWFALENSANLRTRGADRVLGALEDLGYACWPLVVRARDLGANHERPRCWLVGCDADQVAGDPITGFCGWAGAFDEGGAVAAALRRDQRQQSGWRRGAGWASSALDGLYDQAVDSFVTDADPDEERRKAGGLDGSVCGAPIATDECSPRRCGTELRDVADADEAGSSNGCVVASLRPAEVADHGCGDERSDDVAGAYADDEGQSACAFDAEMGRGSRFGVHAIEPWSDWNGGLAGHLRLDDGVSARLAGTRVAVGGGRGTSAAALVVEAFGDAVIPQIPEAIGAAIWRVESAMAAVRRPL